MYWENATCESCIFRSKDVFCRLNPPQVDGGRPAYPTVKMISKEVSPLEKWYPACAQYKERTNQ